MKFYGQKIGDEIVMSDPMGYDRYVAGLKDDCLVELELKPRRKYRSLPQNNLYWAYLSIISEYTGYNSEELHSSFKAMFLTDSSLKIPLVRSTTMLSTQEFNIYLDKLRLFCIEELDIPDENLPNPESYEL